MSLIDRPLAYAQTNASRFVAELRQIVSFPTISAQPERADDLMNCAQWLSNHLRRVGLEGVRIIPTAGSPLVYAEWLRAPGRPTLLIYGHYDVQPVDPLDEWRSPPFQPVVRNDNLYGRGASDDKGQLFCLIKALESFLRTTGRLPINVKCLFEGEEEIGSPNLTPFLVRNKHALEADAVVVSDMPMAGPGRPAITCSMRGALAMELEVTGPSVDLHAGIFGGAVHNPIQALCELTASLHDPDGRITIPGFYDRVDEVSDAERDYMAGTSPMNMCFANDWGERGYTSYERTTVRPALTINGISGGYQGPGVKAVIPARASAKYAFRLVPNQDPREIERLFRNHIRRNTPPTVQTTVHSYIATRPVQTNCNNRLAKASARAYRQAFGVAPVFIRSGGSNPAVSAFQDVLREPIILMGFSLPDDRIHAPNEKFHLPTFRKAIKASIFFIAELGRQRPILP